MAVPQIFHQELQQCLGHEYLTRLPQQWERLMSGMPIDQTLRGAVGDEASSGSAKIVLALSP